MPCRDVRRALARMGFEQGETKGSHEHWRKIVNGHLLKATLDCHKGEVRAKDVRSMIGQAKVTKKEFYAAANGDLVGEPESHARLFLS